ncbi:S8 family serine peptidase [Schumannella sp. 10F1B-5-1]|uniref:S8 family peptidase n=1 Tax=Schumannella sp. 10F1B-5-1 TaxID=2590780 RepID=UPI002101FBE9|nr:S8 family serine peptidase [Schumannella sp. 10F1B-5-1]
MRSARSVRRAAAGVATLALAVGAALVPAVAAQADDVRNREYWLQDYGIEKAWATTKGKGQTIAVIDSGVDPTHPDLAGAVVGGKDFSGFGGPTGQPPAGDDNEHGTMVASLAAGRGTSATDGIIGSAPEASILAISIGFGSQARNSDQQIADAVTWAVDNGADVINMSFSRNTPDWPESWDKAFLYAMEHDVVIVAAAGNRGSGITSVGAPATMPGVLVVGGVDRQGVTSFDASTQGITIGVSAPSEELVGATPGGGRAIWSGTSGASPIVAGIVALVKAAHPDLDADNVINRVVKTAHDAGTPGVDFLYGYGLVDASAAVSGQVDTVKANPMGDLADWVRVYRRADGAPVTPATRADRNPPAAVPAPVVPWSPVGTLLPDPRRLSEWGMPALAFTGLAAVWIALIVGGVRTVRSGRRTR